MPGIMSFVFHFFITAWKNRKTEWNKIYINLLQKKNPFATQNQTMLIKIKQ